MTGPSVEFDHVNLVLGGSQILSDVSFTVAPGALHCIVGPNGGGKSSLVKALLGQMPHTGRIAVGRGDKAVVGYVPQTLDFDRNLPMTVEDVMGMMRQRRPVFTGANRKNRAAISTLLERTGVAHRLKAPFGALSGGERQRVLLAQALDPAPQLLILDEPMAGLDEAGGRLIEDLVMGLHAEGITIVWINHDWAQVRRLATQVTGIARTVTFDGPPDLVLPMQAGAAA